MSIHRAYEKIKVGTIGGRYIHHEHIAPFLNTLPPLFSIKDLGTSVNGLPIKKVTVGHGPVKVLMWSQMHGNESTTTKAVFDLLNALNTGYGNSKELLERLTLVIIPMLNPDGALAYTRENANGIDLNRDARNRTQPESKILRSVFDALVPDYCFNLHDQRTIFSAGNVPNPATLSFLSPSADAKRTITKNRLRGMNLIAEINDHMQQYIPGQIGRYDDAFNANCVGDTFQMQETPTILFEAGHSHGDYEREKTREYVFIALWKALEAVGFHTLLSDRSSAYHAIPENEKNFCDILIRNAHLLHSQLEAGNVVGILYKECLHGDRIHFKPCIDKIGLPEDYFGHLTYDCMNSKDIDFLKEDKSLLNLIISSLRNK